MTTITVEWYNRGYRKCTTFSPYGADPRKENMTHCRTIATTARITDRSRAGGKVCFYIGRRGGSTPDDDEDDQTVITDGLR